MISDHLHKYRPMNEPRQAVLLKNSVRINTAAKTGVHFLYDDKINIVS